MLARVILFLLLAFPAMAEEWVLVAHPKFPVNELSETDLSRIYLGTMRQLSDVQVHPVQYTFGHLGRLFLNSKILKKTDREIKEYWMAQRIKGRAHPPRTVGSDRSLQLFISRVPGALGFVLRSKLKEGSKLKIILFGSIVTQ